MTGLPGASPDDTVPMLPSRVRKRVARLTAGVIRDLRPNQVPATLRMAAQWRRGVVPNAFVDRLLATLAADDAFRELVASQLVDTDPVGAAVAGGEVQPGADPVAVASLLYLIQPDGWARRLSDALSAVGEQPEQPPAPTGSAAMRNALDRAKERRERDVAAARREGAAERAELGRTVARLQTRVAALERDLAAARALSERSAQQAAEREIELRRVRGQLEATQLELGQRKASQRSTRLAANARAKVLLEVLSEAANGLAAELALPAGTPRPADLVPGAPVVAETRSKRIGTAAALTQELTSPRCHLIVDGYNVSKGMWPAATLQVQRESLIAGLASLASRTGAEITVVFDGASVGNVPASTPRSVRVRFSEPGELADRLIVRLVDIDTSGRPLVVVSSDAALVSGAIAAGARTADRAVLSQLLGKGGRR